MFTGPSYRMFQTHSMSILNHTQYTTSTAMHDQFHCNHPPVKFETSKIEPTGHYSNVVCFFNHNQKSSTQIKCQYFCCLPWNWLLIHQATAPNMGFLHMAYRAAYSYAGFDGKDGFYLCLMLSRLAPGFIEECLIIDDCWCITTHGLFIASTGFHGTRKLVFCNCLAVHK